MTFSLYAATIPTFLQITRSIRKLLDTAETFCSEQKLSPETLIQGRLIEDMAPFTMQVRWVSAHSIGAIDGMRKGVFVPDLSPPPSDFAALKSLLDTAVERLAALTPGDVDSLMGGDMRFEYGELKMPFVAEDFLLSFSQPNFFFHATTAYDILRMKGVPIGKRDFLGVPRLKA